MEKLVIQPGCFVKNKGRNQATCRSQEIMALMKVWSSITLAVCSAIALLPASIFLVLSFSFFFGVVMAIAKGEIFLPDGALDYEFLYLGFSYVSGVFALVNFWGLAIATAKERQVPNSWRIWLAIGCGVIAAVGATMIGGLNFFIFFVLPAVVLVICLLGIQWKRHLRRA